MRRLPFSVLLAALLPAMLLAPARLRAQAGKPPWSANTRPPALAGVSLGQSLDDLTHALGAPDAADTLAAGTVSVTWFAKGISAVVSQKDGVGIVNATKRAAAELAGVRVGDTHAAVRAALGEPTRVQGPAWVYDVAGWALVVQFHSQSDAVVRIGVGRKD